jgi:hypothetical protein
MKRRHFPTPDYDPTLVRRFPEAERKPIKFTRYENDLHGLDEFGTPIYGNPTADLVDWHTLERQVDYWLD